MPVVTTPPPPRAATPRKQTPKQTSVTKARTDAVNGIWQLIGVGCMMTGNLADVGTIQRHAPNVTTEIVNLAESDDKIASAIDKLAVMGPYGALITAALPLIMQTLVNHDRLRAGPAMSQMGVVPKAALEAEIRQAMAEAEAQAFAMQKQAEEQLAAIKEEARTSREQPAA